MIITLTGENTYAIASAERQLIVDFTKKYGVNGVERVDAEQITPARLPDLLQGASLFAPQRLVILKSLGANKPIQEVLTNFLPKTADEITVVICDSALDKRTRLYKFLKSKSQFKEFANLSDSQLCAWLSKEAAQLGGEIKPAVAQYLLTRAGRDQWRLANEIQKLVSFKPEITKESVDILVEATPEGTAFELLDAALAGKVNSVQKIISNIKSQEDPYKLFGLLASQAYALAVVASAGGRSADVVAKEAGLHPFVVRKTQGLAKRLGESGVAKIAADVAICDSQLKSTSANPWSLVQLCLQKIAGAV